MVRVTDRENISHPEFPLSDEQDIFKSILIQLQSVFLKYQLVKIAKNSEMTEAHGLTEEISLSQRDLD